MKYLIIIGLALLGVVVQAQNQVGYTRRATLETMWPVPYNTWIIDYPGADSINVFVRDPSDNTSPASWRVIVGRNGIRYIRRTPPNMFNSANYYTKVQTDNSLRSRPQFASGFQANYLPTWRASDSTLIASNVFNNPSAGSVGIGTTSPTRTLDVIGSGAFRTLFVEGNASVANTRSQIQFNTSLGAAINNPNMVFRRDAPIGGIVAAYKSYRMVNNTNVGFVLESSTQALENAQTWTRRFRVVEGANEGNVLINETNGNVGIGLTEPSSKLHVAGTVTANAFSTTGALSSSGLDLVRGNTTETGGALRFLNGALERWRLRTEPSISSFDFQINKISAGGSITNTPLTLKYGTNKIFINTDTLIVGAEGYQTPLGGQRLQVAGGVITDNATAQHLFVNTPSGGTGHSIRFQQNGANRWVIGGLLGGNNLPFARWSGGSQIDIPLTLRNDNGQITFGNYTSASAFTGAVAALLGTTSAGDVITVNPNTYISSTGGSVTGTGGAGFLGLIAQTSPPSAPASGVRVFANSLGRLAWEGTDGFARSFNFSSMSADREVTFPAEGTVGMLGSTQTWSGTNTFSGNTFLATSSGNVGIGTSSPVQRLTIGASNGVSNPQLLLQESTHATSRRAELQLGNWILINDLFANGTRDFSIYNLSRAKTDFFISNSLGNVGINTLNPHASAILDVVSTTGGVGFPQMTTTQRDAISSPRAGLVIFNTTADKLQVRTSSTWVDLH